MRSILHAKFDFPAYVLWIPIVAVLLTTLSHQSRWLDYALSYVKTVLAPMVLITLLPKWRSSLKHWSRGHLWGSVLALLGVMLFSISCYLHALVLAGLAHIRSAENFLFISGSVMFVLGVVIEAISPENAVPEGADAQSSSAQI